MRTHVVTIGPDATLRDALDLMDLYQTVCLPVIDDWGQLCGVLTEHDVCAALLSRSEATGETLSVGPLRTLPTADTDSRHSSPVSSAPGGEQAVRQHMTAPAYSVSITSSVAEASALLLHYDLRRLPVLDDDGRVVGLIGRVDICQALLDAPQ